MRKQREVPNVLFFLIDDGGNEYPPGSIAKLYAPVSKLHGSKQRVAAWTKMPGSSPRHRGICRKNWHRPPSTVWSSIPNVVIVPIADQGATWDVFVRGNEAKLPPNTK
jgi:hypothetical protein